MEAIRTEKLTKSYGKARGIIDLDLTVEPGEFFGFIGPNGAGKSTTIRTLLGLIRPTGGRAWVLGQDITGKRNDLLARVGYLPSEAVFYSGMRVREVLKLSAGLRKTDCKQAADALCQRLQLDPERKVDELSFGNRKKVCIVCALQHDPELLILDEPTSGLDPLMQREFFALLEERCRGGATVFLSSHVLSEVQRHCRHAAVIREGRLLAMDSVEKLGHTDARRVTLRGVHELPPLPELRDARAGQDGVTFLYGGDMPTLLGTLAGLPVTDVTITEPDLEEVFLHYYAKEAE